MNMEEKLTLEHLAVYLPYKLIIADEDMRYMEMTSIFCNGYVYADWGSLSVGDHEYNINEIKPLLHPLSKLTQEIEHNGEKFVPIEKLDYTFGNHSDFCEEKNQLIQNDNWIKIWKDKSFFSISIDDQIIFEPYCVVRQLFEWHFDVFGLIEKGLAIEKQ